MSVPLSLLALLLAADAFGERRRHGTYLLRTDRTDLAAAEVWQLYVLLARIERSFRYLKSTLGIRPVFHQRTERVDAHIFISLLAYHLVHTIERRLQDNGRRAVQHQATDTGHE